MPIARFAGYGQKSDQRITPAEIAGSLPWVIRRFQLAGKFFGGP